MKQSILSLLSILMTFTAFAQTETAGYKTVADRFGQLYNAGNYAGIFAMFSTEMQGALPLEKTTDFFTSLKGQAGNITRLEFSRQEQSYAIYKTNFERALLGVHISLNSESKINGMFVRPFTESSLPKPKRNAAKLMLPFRGEWTVIWGGDTKELNYHVESEAQKGAFDLVITDEKGSSYKGDGTRNEDYYAFGKELLAPCDGEVVLVVDGIKDNQPGVMNPVYIPGNTVIVKAGENEYLFFAHFKQHSIKVKQGQKVKGGQVLGLCGNSGNSSEAHLHFHIQNVEDMATATGIKCYFDRLLVNGQLKTDYSPVQKDKIKP